MYKFSNSEFNRLEEFVDKVPFNTLFAKMVVRDKVSGEIYVDNLEKPETFLIVHGYGMALLFGNESNENFNKALMEEFILTKHEIQKCVLSYPEAWNDQLSKMLGEKLVKITKFNAEEQNKVIGKKDIIEESRVNFSFNKGRYTQIKRGGVPEGYKIERINGTVVPKYFWKSPEDFVKYGMGYCLMKDNEIISTSFSAYSIDKYLEIGIETSEAYRGKGLGVYASYAIIDYCLENNLEPAWGCRKGNLASLNIAQKLGFDVIEYRPYYCLLKE